MKFQIHRTILIKVIISALIINNIIVGNSNAKVLINNAISPAADHAINILTSTKPMYDPYFEMGFVDQAKSKANAELYRNQLIAISLLGKEKIPGTAPYIIPFLNYPSRNVEGQFRGGLRHGVEIPVEDTNNTRIEWPAFSALLDIPGAHNDLKAYALDKQNPAESRFAAFAALRYLDKSDCELVGKALSAEFSGSEGAQINIKAVESGRFIYSGANFYP